VKNNVMKEIIKEKLLKCEILLTEEKLYLLENYFQEVIRRNEIINLTSVIDEKEFAEKHIIDSLYLNKLFYLSESGKLIDVGTGAGIPGIILKIVRDDLNITLLDSVKKKTDFLNDVIEKLDLKNIYVINDRAENLGKNREHRENYDYSVARAVSNLSTLAEFCLPFVKVGGFFLAMKGEKAKEEIDGSIKAVEIMGGKIEDIISYDLPSGYKRKIIVIRKIKNTPENYPRRPGIPEKRPIK